MSLKDHIKTVAKSSSELVHVADWDATVEVRPLTVRGRAAIYNDARDLDGNMSIEKLYPMLIIASVYDPEEGTQVFTTEDVSWLVEQPAGPIELLAQKCITISGLDQTAVEAGKAGS